MRKIIYALYAILAVSVFISCSESDENLENLTEEQIMQRFIKSQGIVILEEYPEDHNFGDNEYYKTDLGLYFQVVNFGNGKSAIPNVDIVQVRFDYYINVNKYITGNRDTIVPRSEYFPMEFKYKGSNLGYYDSNNSNNYSCQGWAIPLDYIYEGAIVNLIIPSKLGIKNDREDKIIRFYKNLVYTNFY